VVKIVGAYAIEAVKVFSFLASPFVKGGSWGIFINHRSLIFNDYCLIGIIRILSQPQYAPTVFLIGVETIKNLFIYLCLRRE